MKKQKNLNANDQVRLNLYQVLKILIGWVVAWLFSVICLVIFLEVLFQICHYLGVDEWLHS